MDEEVLLNHVAIQYSDLKLADVFFTEILNIPKEKSYTLSKDLSEKIFNIPSETEIVVYKNDKICFEVFLSKYKKETDYTHICIEVKDRKEFMKLCQKRGLNSQIIKKGDKKLMFIKDFSNNLYEIKDKQKL